jgi:hypothetical protein
LSNYYKKNYQGNFDPKIAEVVRTAKTILNAKCGIAKKFLILGLYMAKLELVNPPKAWSSFNDQTKTSLLKSRSFDFLPAFQHTNAQQNNSPSPNISIQGNILLQE